MEMKLSHISLHIKFCRFCCHNADWRETKTKTDYTIWNIYKGSLIIEINNKKMSASEGDILFFHPGDTYTAFCNGDCCNFLVTFFTFDTGNCVDVFRQYNSAGIYSVPALKEISDGFCRKFLDNYENITAVPMKLYALFLMFLSELFPYFGTQDCFYEQPVKALALKMNRLLAYIDENIEKKISIKELASYIGMSEKYFIHFFHSHTGYSPKQYMINQRMNYSVSLLSDPALTLSEIALKMDFSDQYAFSKAFKKYYGEAPDIFRKHYLADSGL